MDIAYLHVIINHLPIMAVPVLLAVLVLGLWTRSGAVQRAALLGFVAVGLATVGVYATGLGAEHFAEHLPEVRDDDVIDAHRAMATVGFASMSALALLAAAVFVRGGGLAWLRRRGEATPVAGAWLVVLLAAITAGALGYTGRLGGKITHTEFTIADANADGHDDADDADEGGHQRRRRRGRD